MTDQRTPPRETRVARWCVARALRSLGRGEAAATGEPDGFIHEELGELLLMEDGAAARPHLARAYELLSADPWLAAHEPERLARLRDLGAG